MSIFDDMDDDEFTDAVAEAYKGKQLRPAWWLRLLRPDIIDRTESALDRLMDRVERQARAGNSAAATFAKKLNGAMTQVQLERSLQDGQP